MKKLIAVVVPVFLVTGLFMANSSALRSDEDGRPLLLAHRGIAQTFPIDGVEIDTCTATRIHPPEHHWLENTLDSMRAAFDAGADMVEFDVQVSADRQLVVFHDSTLDCRTDGSGKVKDHTLAELRRLDVGYGYTADGGATFPLRGTGAGLMPTVEEVVAAFPGRELLLDLKNEDTAETGLLADYLSTLPPGRLAAIAAYGGDASIAYLRERLPQLRVASRATMKSCMIDYLGAGWTGYVPDSCRNTELHLPQRYARWMWGWPNLFQERMSGVGTRVILVAGDGAWSEGFDNADTVREQMPEGWSGWLWTNRTDVIAYPLRRESS